MFVPLAYVYEIQILNRSEKYISICSDSQAALKALKAVRTTSPLVRQCQEALNDISARHVVGLFWVPGHAGVRGNEIADELARSGSALRFLGPEPALGVSRCDIRRKLGCWLCRQHRANWHDPANTLRQARELISGPCPGTRVKFLSFNRIQSRAVTGLLTGHNTLWRHLHLTAHYVESVELKWKPRLTFCVSARLWPHLGADTWGPSFWNQRTLKEFKPGSHLVLW
jgi:hypothetical protein